MCPWNTWCRYMCVCVCVCERAKFRKYFQIDADYLWNPRNSKVPSHEKSENFRVTYPKIGVKSIFALACPIIILAGFQMFDKRWNYRQSTKNIQWVECSATECILTLNAPSLIFYWITVISSLRVRELHILIRTIFGKENQCLFSCHFLLLFYNLSVFRACLHYSPWLFWFPQCTWLWIAHRLPPRAQSARVKQGWKKKLCSLGMICCRGVKKSTLVSTSNNVFDLAVSRRRDNDLSLSKDTGICQSKVNWVNSVLPVRTNSVPWKNNWTDEAYMHESCTAKYLFSCRSLLVSEIYRIPFKPCC